MNRLVVVSNRVPDPQAGVQAGGLAVALESLMQSQGGLWFGWSGKVSDHPESEPAIIRSDQVDYATVDLTEDEHERYYNGFSNSILWPLLHSLPDLMTFDRRNAQVYRQVNERLAASLVPLLRPNDMIWVHDYHLLAMPAILRAKGVLAPIGFFLHVPFPTADVMASAPDARALLRDLLASDLIGFQTSNDLDNFSAAAQRLAGAMKLSDDCLSLGGRRVRLGVFPVEIEPREFARLAEDASQTAESIRLRRSLSGQKLIVGVDRLDPTKGLVHRINGLARLFATHPEWRGEATMLQIAAVSRQDVASYRELRMAMERAAGSVNSEYGEPDWTPLRVIARAGARATVAGYMRQASVGLVTPLRDGMNLVAKEFVAAQDPQNPGVLVLSRFAGAARQLSAALMVNPHDSEDIAEALHTGLSMSLAERQDRWRAMWQVLDKTSAQGWGRGFVDALLVAADQNGAAVARKPGLTEAADALAPMTEQPIALGERPALAAKMGGSAKVARTRAAPAPAIPAPPGGKHLV